MREAMLPANLFVFLLVACFTTAASYQQQNCLLASGEVIALF